MAKQIFMIFHRPVDSGASEWHKLPHYFSSKEKAEEWAGPMLEYRDDCVDEYHIQGYDMDPEPIQYY